MRAGKRWIWGVVLAVTGGTGSAQDALDDLSCLLEPNMTVPVSSEQPGIIDTIAVERGDRVARGQVLVRFRSGLERAAVDLAAARLAFGRRKAERNRDLREKQLISAHEADEMETENRVAELELREARERLAMRTVKSSISGVVVERSKAPGEFVGEDPMLTVVSIDPLNVEVIVPASALGRIRKGMRAEVRPDVLGGSYRATVTIVDPVVDPTSDTFGVRLALPNPDGRLPAGLKCRIRFLEAE